ncbi:MAG: TAXI family TRAP transporter solute-binding subunit [Proteobacteria bacterium]|nr:TAXI family TRAP transporter solute-binding subunit [Pseudomonadota bacterium]
MLKQLSLMLALLSIPISACCANESPKQITNDLVKAETAAKPAIKLGTKRYPDDKSITMDTGNTTGVYYTSGDAICRIINQHKRKLGLRCNNKATLGSIPNIEALRNGEAQLAIVQSDIQENALRGGDIYATSGAFEPLRFLFSLHDESFTVIVRRDSDIKRLDDLSNKIFNIGPIGSGIRAAAATLMQIKGWTLRYFQSVTELKVEEQADALCQNKIDAMVLVTGHPSKLVENISKMCEIRLLPLDDEQIKQFVNNNKGYELTTIPGDLYHGLPFEINTIGVKATMLTTTDLSDDIAYKVTKTTFENLVKLRKVSPVLAKLDKEIMVTKGQIATIHPGAERYFKEIGLLKEPQQQPHTISEPIKNNS